MHCDICNSLPRTTLDTHPLTVFKSQNSPFWSNPQYCIYHKWSQLIAFGISFLFNPLTVTSLKHTILCVFKMCTSYYWLLLSDSQFSLRQVKVGKVVSHTDPQDTAVSQIPTEATRPLTMCHILSLFASKCLSNIVLGGRHLCVNSLPRVVMRSEVEPVTSYTQVNS